MSDVGSQGYKRSAVASNAADTPLASTTRISLDDVQGVVDSALDQQHKGMQKLLANLSEGMQTLDKQAREHTQNGFNELGNRISNLEKTQKKTRIH